VSQIEPREFHILPFDPALFSGLLIGAGQCAVESDILACRMAGLGGALALQMNDFPIGGMAGDRPASYENIGRPDTSNTGGHFLGREI
jgi:hypothetical protein